MSTIRESEEWDGKAPWNPQWFWPQAILFGFGAAGIVAGLNYRRLGRSRLIWPTIVISSVVFIGVLAGLAFVDRGYVVVTAIIINAPAALILFLLQRADYNSFRERMSNGVSGGLDLPVMIGLPWRLWFCWRSLSLFRLKTRLKKSHRLRNKSRKAWTGLAEVTLSVLFPVLTRPLNSRLRWLRPTISEARLTAYWIGANRLFKTSMMRSGSILKTRRSSFLGGVSLDVLGEYQRAKSDYDEAIRLDPDDGVAYYNRTIVHTRLGMDREAQADADRADGLGFDPSLLENAMNAARAER